MPLFHCQSFNYTVALSENLIRCDFWKSLNLPEDNYSKIQNCYFNYYYDYKFFRKLLESFEESENFQTYHALNFIKP